jgi:FlaG/FlaF family flagellin (archaellin)
MPAFSRLPSLNQSKVNKMESIKSVKDAKAAGTAIGAACEIAIGDTLTARVLEVLKTLPKGKAVSLIDAFWQGFDAAAPSIRGLKRIKVTRSESMRIARGIDAGLVPVASWAESVKAAPKAASGKGSGGGRKPRQPVAPAGEVFTAPVKGKSASVPTEPPNLSPIAACRQAVAVVVALAHNHKSRLSLAYLDAVEELAKVAKAELK